MGLTEAEFESVKRRGIKGPDRTDRFPFPVPNGWFAVARSIDLKPGETKNVHYFARDLVVWREDGDGTPHVVDAYCPHLGAHLGVGAGSPESHEPGPGIVTGGCIQCPFHGWRFDGEGRCREIPYAQTKRIPERARVKAYPTIEKNGMIFAWHHALDEPPQWDLPTLPELEDDEWEGPIYTDRYIDVAMQELHENDQDAPHFIYVHGAEAQPEQVTRWEGRYRITEAVGPDGEPFTREYCQLGFGIMRRPTVLFMSATSPIDEGHTHQHWVFAYPKRLGPEVGGQLVDAFAKSGIYQDIPIWEHKVFRERPVLVKGDGQIMECRRWAAQFYTWPDGQVPRWARPADEPAEA